MSVKPSLNALLTGCKTVVSATRG